VAGNLQDHIDNDEAHEQYTRRDTLNARGSMYVAEADGVVVELPVGPISGYVLMSINAGIGGLMWMPPSWVPFTAFLSKGDLLVGTGPGTYAVLPVGATGQVLTVDPATTTGLRWEDPAVVTCPYGLDFSYECDSGYVALI
jgi:hypothetical protein